MSASYKRKYTRNASRDEQIDDPTTPFRVIHGNRRRNEYDCQRCRAVTSSIALFCDSCLTKIVLRP